MGTSQKQTSNVQAEEAEKLKKDLLMFKKMAEDSMQEIEDSKVKNKVCPAALIHLQNILHASSSTMDTMCVFSKKIATK